VITVLIGQRGTGKTSLLRRIEFYLAELNESVPTWDLDAEIERAEGRSISQIFGDCGEAGFRVLERTHFEHLVSLASGRSAYIAVGGGFNTELFAPSMRILWLQRTTDRDGRIFLDRPSLDPMLSPLQEFISRAEKRRIKFQEVAGEEYLVPEGLMAPDLVERQIVVSDPQNVGGILTILPHHVQSAVKWNFFVQRRLRWGLDFFEIRDDLLSEDQIGLVLSKIPKSQILWSRRCPVAPKLFFKEVAGWVDYDREINAKPGTPENKIISVHGLRPGEKLGSLLSALEVEGDQGYHIKLAIEIDTFAELILGHQWRMAKPKGRSFLPRSSSGRWQWYRILMAGQQRLSFFREGEGSAADQPSLFQWLHRKKTGLTFAALLGRPVVHSYTPVYHGRFFAAHGLSVVAVDVCAEEFGEAFAFLESLGLVAAAVTSPLKNLAWHICHEKTSTAGRFLVANTLIKMTNGTWKGHNTDFDGLEALLHQAFELEPIEHIEQIAVWGGGGTLPIIKAHLDQAQFYSARTGLLREGQTSPLVMPRWLLWAGARLRSDGMVVPPGQWRPQLVVDLNYTEDSGGREYARLVGAKYLSGATMFFAQADAQRIFWSKSLADC
jgi:shikimate 5-dehydrogenase/shikimate kinase